MGGGGTISGAFLDRAEALVRRTEARVTRPRVEVLAVLLAAGRALTHQQVARQANRALGIDRVTIYRVLEWLTVRDLAHQIAGEDRVWRFNAAADERAQRHAHFRCNRCGEVTCLEKVVPMPSIALPSGYRSQEVELTVKGLCASCMPARAGRRRAQGAGAAPALTRDRRAPRECTA
jgi:Fur family ferric uptake transcriptional regulator